MNVPLEMVVIAKLGAAVGLKGHIRLNYYSDNIALIKKHDFYYDDFTKKCKLGIVGNAKGKLIVAIDGVSDRTAAEKWCNILLYLPRADFPEIATPDEYYITDLIGLDVVAGKKLYGKVSHVHNFGAGDIVEITTQNGEDVMLIFNHDNFPHVDLKNRQIICNPPEIMLTEKLGE